MLIKHKSGKDDMLNFDQFFMGSHPLSLEELLVMDGAVTLEQVARAHVVRQESGKGIAEILTSEKICEDERIREVFSRRLGVQVIELSDFSPSDDLLDLIPTEAIREFELIPISFDGDLLRVATTDPFRLEAIAELCQHCSYTRLEVVKCSRSDFKWFLKNFLEAQTVFEEILQGGTFYEKALSSLSFESVSEEEDEADLQDVQFSAEQAPIITLCNFLLIETLKRRASDLHMEPYEESLRLRLRIDGRLQTLLSPPKELYLPIISRFKVMADLDITKTRLPQDGRISIRHQGSLLDYRVSTLPTVFGEKCVIRLLKKQFSLMDLDRIGFDERTTEVVQKAIRKPQGIILVTGPTGSGKTTTVHSALNEINDIEMNIITLEDPCETSIPGINHVQIKERGGLSFAAGLRSILRQDPDVIFVGEMRDTEVSQIAVRAALTGHLVMSTLHTNSAAETLTRLVDMGIPGYLLCHGLQLIVAQRLVRMVCDWCAIPHEPSEIETDEFGLTPELMEGADLKQAQGCPRCRNTGYHGRTAVYEVLEIDTEIRELIRKDAHASEIVRLARGRGMQSIFEAGVARALSGATTLKEVRRVLSDVQ